MPIYKQRGIFLYAGITLLITPLYIRMLYCYEQTGFKFLLICVVTAFVYYAFLCFLISSTLFTLAYENFNPQKLEQLKEAFSVLIFHKSFLQKISKPIQILAEFSKKILCI